MVLEMQQGWDEAGGCVRGCWALSINSDTAKAPPQWASTQIIDIPQAWLAVPLGVITFHPLKISASSLNWLECAPDSTPLVANVALPGWPVLYSGQKQLITCTKAIL